MKYALPVIVFATPALAHTGPHLHPHGSESWVALAGMAALVGGAVLLAWRK